MKPLLNFFVFSFVMLMAIGSVISLAYVSAQVDVGQIIGDVDGVSIIIPETPLFNNNTIGVNSSEFANIWITSNGHMDNIPDLYPTFIGSGFNSTINIHDQDLNTTSNNVQFNTTNITTSLAIGNGSDFSHELDVHGHVEFEHVADQDGDHALEIDLDAAGFGDVKAIFIDYDSGAIVLEQDEEVIFLNIDQFEALGGAITGVLIVSTEGVANITGLQVGVGIHPLFQLSGIFGNMDSALNNSVDVRTAFITQGDDVDIFVEDDDTVTIGNDLRFEEMEWIFNRSAGGAGIKPQFWHSTGVNTWSLFAPADGTNGFRDSGVIIWEISDIPDWEVGLNSEFLIRINRTQNNIPVTPIENLVQIAVAEDFFWDKNGDLKVNSINASSWSNVTFPIDQLSDVSASSPSTNDFLKWSGSVWEAFSLFTSQINWTMPHIFENDLTVQGTLSPKSWSTQYNGRTTVSSFFDWGNVVCGTALCYSAPYNGSITEMIVGGEYTASDCTWSYVTRVNNVDEPLLNITQHTSGLTLTIYNTTTLERGVVNFTKGDILQVFSYEVAGTCTATQTAEIGGWWKV